jgi:tRNA G18 (ribose-2'-O)-methylase SpoU
MVKIEVVLYNIRSVYNVASITRTLEASGLKKIYLCGITPGPYDKYNEINEKFTKVSLGAEKNIFFERKKSIIPLIKNLKKQGYKILSLEQDKNSVNLFKFRPNKKEKYVLLLGEERRGLPKKVLNLSDKILEIPLCGKKESLNVSVAFGIAIFYLINKI